MKNYEKLLERIDTLGEEMRYYGNLSVDMLKHELKVNSDVFFAGANICGYYSDQDGGEVDDDFYGCIVEELREF